MTTAQQLIAQVRPQKAGSAGDETGGHSDLAYGLRLRHGRFAALAAGLAVACCGLIWASAAEGWSSGSAVYSSARPQPLALAGDDAGNGVGVTSGASADAPLLLLQRDAVAAGPDGVALSWNAATPLPGGVPDFTTNTAAVESAVAVAAGEGAAAIVLRARDGATDTLTAIVRDAGDRFGDPGTIVPGNFARLSDPAVAVSAAGTTVVGFDAARPSGRRAGYAARLSGNAFAPARVISLPGAGGVAAAVGPGELGLVTWTRAGRAELSALDDRGRAGRYRVLGSAARGAEIAAAGYRGGAIVAWEGPRGAVRVVRRGGVAGSHFGRPLTARAGTGADLTGMRAAVDAAGVAYVTWREGTGTRTRLLVARGAAGHRFTIDQVAAGAGLGLPATVARPIGGAIVGWAARSGWQARKVPSAGGLPIQSTVSNPGTSTAVPLTRPLLTAGPGARADMTWLQPSAAGPGFDLMQSQETDP